MSHGPAARVCIFFCWFLGFSPPKKKEKRKINKDVRMGLINQCRWGQNGCSF